MIGLQVKRLFVISLAAVNLVLLIWAVLTHRQRRVLPAGYYRLVPVSVAIGFLQLAIGGFFLIQGRQPYLQHLIYGGLVELGVVLQLLLRAGTRAGEQYRNKPLVHAALDLFVALVGLRSWMTG